MGVGVGNGRGAALKWGESYATGHDWLGARGGKHRAAVDAGRACVVFDRNPDAVRQLAGEGTTGTNSLDELIRALIKPRVSWAMVPAGDPTEQTVMALAERMEPGDIIEAATPSTKTTCVAPRRSSGRASSM